MTPRRLLLLGAVLWTYVMLASGPEPALQSFPTAVRNLTAATAQP